MRRLSLRCTKTNTQVSLMLNTVFSQTNVRLLRKHDRLIYDREACFKNLTKTKTFYNRFHVELDRHKTIKNIWLK